MEIQNENLLRQALASGLNLFLGAGFPSLAHNKDGKGFPTGGELAGELADEFGDMVPVLRSSSLDVANLSQICSIIASAHSQQLADYLTRRFTVGDFSEEYRILDKLNLRRIFTTNIDDLVPRIFENSDSHYINDVTIRGVTFHDRDAIDYVPLHGSVIFPQVGYAFTATELATAFASDPDKWHVLTEGLQDAPTLFWGYGMRDSGLLQSISPRTTLGRPHKSKWILVRHPDEVSAEYYKALNLWSIAGDTAELLDYLAQFVAPAISAPRLRTTANLFPHESVPALASLPVRPLREFYAGAAPSWYDVLSNNLCRTSHYDRLADHLVARHSLIAIGLPACGKTTLLMQLAADLDFPGHKLVLDSPTVDQSKLMLKKLGTDRALVLVDNFTSDIDAFEVLLKAPGVTVAGFDRVYDFGIIRHIVSRLGCEVLDVTELSEIDMQHIYERIPPEVRRYQFAPPQVARGRVPYLYEVVRLNVTGPAMRDRFRAMLPEMERANQTEHDLLIMCCYVRCCRTPVSFDMAYAFLRDKVASWEDVFRHLDNLGKWLGEYSGELRGISLDSEQDYYVPRSTIIAEAAIEEVRPEALKRILVKFHSEVSPYRICRFDVFRKRAFDAELAARAFADVDEGVQFYERMYERDQSAFLLQQGALFLSRKGLHQRAFEWIDRAESLTSGRIFSIRNAHAVIMFRANIHKDASLPDVRGTLRKSMEILSACYRADGRRIYHALTFARQALEFWSIYQNDEGSQYLETALAWLREDQAEAPYDRDVRNRLRQVMNAISEKGPMPGFGLA